MKKLKLSSPFQLYALIGLISVFFIDLLLPLGVAIGVMYLCCFLFIVGENRKTIIAYTAITIFLISLKAFIYFNLQEVNWMILTNRLISIIAIFFTSIIVLKYRKQKETKNKLQILLNAYQDAINHNIISFVSDLSGKIISVNQKFCDVSKYSKEELEGKRPSIVNSGFHSKIFFKNLWSTISGGNVWRGEIRNKAKDGSYYWVNSTVLPIKNDKDEIMQYLVLQTDISKKKKMELENLKLRDQLISIQEAERSRIAQDLHDGIMQMLAASNMQINALKAICHDHDEGHTSLNVLGSLVVDLLKEARAISHDLSCTSLQAGIISGLNKTIESLCSKCNIILESNIEGKRFSEKLEINVYRILQEIINNTIKHSKATELKIIISQENNNLYINTFDNGIGFDMNIINKKKGLGFSSLKNRTKLINGELNIQSSPNNGVMYNIVIKNVKKLKNVA